MKKFIIPIIAALIAAITLFLVISWWRVSSQAVSSDNTPHRFVIPRGRSASQIGESLYEEGLIKDPLAFKLYSQVTGKTGEIQAGEFTLSPNLTIPQVVDRLTSGPEELWVTIPEGLRREEIVEKVILGLELSGAAAENFRQVFWAESEGHEGFLFPDTYLFPRDVDATLVVAKLRDTFDEKTESLSDEIAESKYSLNQLITIASIVERETKTDEERPIVAGILFNRVELGMPLQADATVQYAVANENCKLKNEKCSDWWPEVTRTNLEIDSPYNTYEYGGFPPAPIANPGISSINASVNPQSTNYLYYIHDSDGQIHYAETLSEHNQNIRQYLGK